MKILVVGKNSYVGTSLKNYFLREHRDDIVNLITSRNNEWRKVDFSGYDAVYNVSGLCHADSKHGTPESYMAINAKLPIEIAKKAKQEGIKLFIHMSSTIIYGNMSRIGEEKYIDDKTVPKPINVYGESKLEAEKGLLKLESESFGTAIIRAPLIYGENARDNFPKLVRFAKTIPVFPNIENKQSMIYVDNLCELIYLIVLNNKRGIYMPQDEKYICTSKLVKDISVAYGKNLLLTKLFNPIIFLFSRKVYLFNKVFGNVAYRKKTSQYFNGTYRVVSYETAIKRIAKYGG